MKYFSKQFFNMKIKHTHRCLCTRHRLAPGVGPGPTRGICRGIQRDGLDSLPMGRETSRQKGGRGIRKFCKIADGNHGDLPLSPTHKYREYKVAKGGI